MTLGFIITLIMRQSMTDCCPKCNNEVFVKDNNAKYILCLNVDCLWWYPVEAYKELQNVLRYMEVTQ